VCGVPVRVGGYPARPGDPPQQRDDADVPDAVRQLGSVARLEVREQVEFAGSWARWQRRSSGTTHSGRSQPPSERGTRCARSTGRPPQTRQCWPATLSRCTSDAGMRGVRPHPRPPNESLRPVRRRTFERSSVAWSRRRLEIGRPAGEVEPPRLRCPTGTPSSSASSLSSKPTSGLKSPAGISNSRAHRSARAWSKVLSRLDRGSRRRPPGSRRARRERPASTRPRNPYPAGLTDARWLHSQLAQWPRRALEQTRLTLDHHTCQRRPVRDR
jgi:hypothetical protein